jgi:uncharacterized spore protein YtfJ
MLRRNHPSPYQRRIIMPEETTDAVPERMNKVLQAVAGTYDRFLSTANANTCFGEPIQVDDKTIIPAAEVLCGSGFGMGFGKGTEDDDDKNGEGEGGGGGGGGFTRTRAVAVVTVSSEGVTVEPVVDATQIAMAGIAATAFVGYWLVRLMKGTTEARDVGKGPSLMSLKRLVR